MVNSPKFDEIEPFDTFERVDPDSISLEDAINWNEIEDEKDLEVWNRLVTNFWVPEKIPLSSDLQSWATLTGLLMQKKHLPLACLQD